MYFDCGGKVNHFSVAKSHIHRFSTLIADNDQKNSNITPVREKKLNSEVKKLKKLSS